MALSARSGLNSAIVHDHDITKRVVENAESRARLRVKERAWKNSRGNNRQYAQALHRQADELCRSGEYESALVLYHRAAAICPRDSSHSVAARRTATTINSWSNLEKTSAGLPASRRDDAITRVTSCPGSATLAPPDVFKSSDLSIIPHVLGNLDNCKKPPAGKRFAVPESCTSRLTRSRTIVKLLGSRADAMLKDLEANFDAGKMRKSLKLAQDLLTLSSDLGDVRRHRIPVYHYLSLIHAALGRHDRASSNVSMLVRLSKSSNDTVLFLRALGTLGKVHLKFGHFEAAGRAWENLSVHIDYPVPRAWIHHEIGRCYLESGKYAETLRKAMRCREEAEQADSTKWIFHACLLKAQCSAMLGRFHEALNELRICARISEEEGDTPMLSYIRDLIDRLNRAPREVTFGEDRCLRSNLRRLSSREQRRAPGGNEAITTFGIRKTACRGSDTLIPSFYSDYLEDNVPDRCEIDLNNNVDEESSSAESATSFKSGHSDTTYVIDSRTEISNGCRIDGTKTHDEEHAGLSSRESHMTFKTCYIETAHYRSEKKTSASLKRPIEARASNAGSGSSSECDAFRISRSCEDTRCNIDRLDRIARSSRERTLSAKTRRNKCVEKAVVPKESLS